MTLPAAILTPSRLSSCSHRGEDHGRKEAKANANESSCVHMNKGDSQPSVNKAPAVATAQRHPFAPLPMPRSSRCKRARSPPWPPPD